MSQLIVHAGDFTFQARFEEQLAPKTCAAFRRAMPFESQAIHVRWSGEGVWMPLGDLDFGVSYENHTSYPAPGQIILYPGGISETEILLAYGGVHFGSKMGQLAGNHFITLTSGLDRLPELGKTVLWKGAREVRFESVLMEDPPTGKATLGAEIVRRIDALGAISETPGQLTRIFLTPEHRAAADLLLQWMQQAGMRAHLDAIGHVC